MKIAIFTNNYLPNPYGVSMSIESFRAELERLGHTVYVFAPAFKGYKDTNPRVFRYPALDIRIKGVRYPLAIPFSYQVSRQLAKLEIDIIHAQHPNLLGWAARRWAKQKNIPLVFTWHTLYDQYAHFVPLLPKKIAAQLAINNAKDFANKCDQVIVPTPSVIQTIRNWGVANPNIVAIASGVNEKLYQNMQRDFVRKKYHVKDEEILLLLVSRLTAEKNVNFLFNSLVPLIKKDQQLKFLMVGGGSERPQLEKQIQENGLSDRMYFAGVIPAAEIKDYYAAADIFVHGSKSETQGMILTEAMYMGLSIVAVNASGAKDLVRNNETGFLVAEEAQEFASAVTKLARDKKLRETFSLHAQDIAKENYTAFACTQKLLAVYQAAIDANHQK